MRTFLIVDGNKAVKEYLKEFKREVRAYKNEFKGWGYTYKEVKPKGAKKPYFYWYKWEYNADQQNNVWTYIGKDKPDNEIPDPPMSRLEEVEFNVVGENILITEVEFNKVADLMNGYQRFEVQSA